MISRRAGLGNAVPHTVAEVRSGTQAGGVSLGIATQRHCLSKHVGDAKFAAWWEAVELTEVLSRNEGYKGGSCSED